jgi:hypothetical protein
MSPLLGWVFTPLGAAQTSQDWSREPLLLVLHWQMQEQTSKQCNSPLAAVRMVAMPIRWLTYWD